MFLAEAPADSQNMQLFSQCSVQSFSAKYYMTPIVAAKYKSVHAKAAKWPLAERREEEVKALAYVSVPVDLPVEAIWGAVGLFLPTE